MPSSSSLTFLWKYHKSDHVERVQASITDKDIIMFSPIKLLILGLATLTLAAPALQPQTPADVYKRATITDVICGSM